MDSIQKTRKRVELMHFYQAQGKNLLEIVPYLGVGERKAKKLAKLYGIKFPDYSPRR